MKIDVRNLRAQLDVKVTGAEDWLGDIYSLFPRRSGPVEARFIIDPLDEYRRTQIELRLSFKPLLECGHCGEDIETPIQLHKSFEFRDEVDPLLSQKEVNLQDDDIEIYYLEEGQLAAPSFINEVINLELPSQVMHNDPEHPCTKIRLSRGSDAVYSDQTESEQNPFAVLKDLKN